MTRIAALPMYNVTPAFADDWRALLADVLHAVEPSARIVEPGDDLHALWRAPDLLLAQTCGYPLTHGLTDAGVQLVATPRFDVEGYEDARYSSAIVVRADAEAVAQRGEVALISGGGAGHEPAHAGYVGPGMLRDRKSTRLNSSHITRSRMPSSA